MAPLPLAPLGALAAATSLEEYEAELRNLYPFITEGKPRKFFPIKLFPSECYSTNIIVYIIPAFVGVHCQRYT